MDKDRERAAHPDWNTKLCFMQYKTFPTRTRTISNKMERRTDCPILTLISNNYGRQFFFQTNNPNNPIFFLLRKIMQSPQQNQARHATPLPCHSTIPCHAKLVYKVTHQIRPKERQNFLFQKNETSWLQQYKVYANQKKHSLTPENTSCSTWMQFNKTKSVCQNERDKCHQTSLDVRPLKTKKIQKTLHKNMIPELNAIKP